MNNDEGLALLNQTGAVLSGHFLLSSGRHSDTFVQKFRILEQPELAVRFGEAIADAFDRDFDVVAAPAVGAVVLGFATALAADARFIFAERVDDAMSFRRGFSLAPGERTLIVEDVITTGGSATEVVELVRASGGHPVGIGALLDRADPARPDDLGAPLRAVVTLQATSWDAPECPLCARGEPLSDPGSRRLKPL